MYVKVYKQGSNNEYQLYRVSKVVPSTNRSVAETGKTSIQLILTHYFDLIVYSLTIRKCHCDVSTFYTLNLKHQYCSKAHVIAYIEEHTCLDLPT